MLILKKGVVQVGACPDSAGRRVGADLDLRRKSNHPSQMHKGDLYALFAKPCRGPATA